MQRAAHNWKLPPVLQRQQGLQAPVYAHEQHANAWLLAGVGQHAGHDVVTPSQVTLPFWRTAQLLSVAEQLVVLLFPWQLMVLPSLQVAVALQRAFSRPPPRRSESTFVGFAAKTISPWGEGQVPLRIAARTSLGRGTWLGA